MPSADFVIEALAARHDRASFICGVDELDRYFRERAGQDARRHIAAVFVLFDASSQHVAGYYTLSATAITRASLPDTATRRLPRYPSIPAILLGRLAVDERYRGQGFGALLLASALRRALGSTGEVAAYMVVVDALDTQARTFYERFGFLRLVDDEFRLFLPMDSIASFLTSQP